MHNDLRAEDGGPDRRLQPDAAALARRDRRIAELADKLEAVLAERDSLAQAMQARFDELALVTSLAERYRAAAERTAPLETGALKEELKRLHDAAERASAREDEVIRLRDALEAEARARQEAEDRARAFEASLSWRVTAPLRRLRALLRRSG